MSSRRLRQRLTLLLIVYFFAGTASQKLIPGVDEIVPLYGWSLFSKVPSVDQRYSVIIESQNGVRLESPVGLLNAPPSIVAGNRFIARKLVQRIGGALDRGEAAEVDHLRRIFEQTSLVGRIRYELVFERYQPLELWRSGNSLERRSLGWFTTLTGDGNEDDAARPD